MPDVEKDSKAPRSRRGLAAALILLVLAFAAVALWLWIGRGSDPAQAGVDNPVRSTLHLDTFVLNAADTDQRAYLRVGLDLGVNQDAKRASEAAPIAQVRDTILGVLSDAKADDLVTSAGKKKLKEDILRTLRERLPELGVEDVYFTEFLIQR